MWNYQTEPLPIHLFKDAKTVLETASDLSQKPNYVGDGQTKGAVGLGDKNATENKTGNNGAGKIQENSWGTQLLSEAKSLWSGAWSSIGNAADAAVTKVESLDTLNFGDIWSGKTGSDQTAAKTGTTDAAGVKSDLSRADSRGTSDSTKGRADLKVSGAQVQADGVTAHGDKVSATVSGDSAQLHTDAGTITSDKHGKTDYSSSQWDGHIENGVGSMHNKQTGQTISYDGHNYVAKDAQGNEIAHSDDLKGLTVQLRRSQLHVLRPGEEAGQHAEQAYNRIQQGGDQHSGDQQTQIFQDAQGNFGIANHDMLIKTNKDQHYVEIQDREGHVVRLKEGADHKRHAYEVVDGQEHELSNDQISGFWSHHQGVSIGSDLSVRVQNQEVVDAQGNVKPDVDSRIDTTKGTLTSKDTDGHQLQTQSHDTGTTVADQGWRFDPQQGFQLPGSDGSWAFMNQGGFGVTEPDGQYTNLGFDGCIQSQDQYGDTLFDLDQSGNSTLWDGIQVNDDGHISSSNGLDSDSYYDSDYQSASSDSQTVCTTADTALDDVGNQLGLSVTPDCDTELAGAESQLTMTLNACSDSGNSDAASQIERKLDDVETTRSQIVKPVAEAQELIAKGLPLSMIGEAQNMAGVTPDGAADKIDDELCQAAA